MSSENSRIRVGDRVTIYPRGKKRIYCADFWDEGKHRRVSLETRNKRIATQRAVQLDADLIAGKFKAPPKPTTIRKAIDAYIDYLTSEGRARKTIVRYRGELEGFRHFCQSHRVTRLAQITLTLFDKYRANRKRIHADRTVHHESTVVKQWLKWSRQRRLVAENPLEDFKLEKPPVDPKGGPSLAQVNKILGACSEPRQTQFAMLAFTGMRSGEMQHLLQGDVDLEGNWIHIVSREGAETKTRESRKVPIHPRLGFMLEAIPKTKHKWLFTANPSARYPDGGNWVNPKRLNDDFLKILRRLGIPAGRAEDGFTVHALRRFFKTFTVNARIPKPVVDVWQGHHGDRSVSAQYYKLDDQASQRFMLEVPFGTGEPAADAGD